LILKKGLVLYRYYLCIVLFMIDATGMRMSRENNLIFVHFGTHKNEISWSFWPQ